MATTGITGSQFADGAIAILSATSVLTNAQIKTLPQQPAASEIVPAPGANKALLFHMGHIIVDSSVFENYTNIDAAAAMYFTVGGVQCSLRISEDVRSQVSDFLNYGDRAIIPFPPTFVFDNQDPQFNILAPDPNQIWEDGLIRLHFSNSGSGNLTGGDDLIRMWVTVYYSVFDVEDAQS